MAKSAFSDEYSVFLRLLRGIRREAGLTQKQLAQRLDQSQSFVSKCERGERRLDIIEVYKFCQAMSVPLEAFVHLLSAAIDKRELEDAPKYDPDSYL